MMECLFHYCSNEHDCDFSLRSAEVIRFENRNQSTEGGSPARIRT